MPHATGLVLNTQFSHYFIAGMGFCLIHRYGARPQYLLIVALALANAIYRGIGFADPLYLIHAHIGFIVFERLGDRSRRATCPGMPGCS